MKNDRQKGEKAMVCFTVVVVIILALLGVVVLVCITTI